MQRALKDYKVDGFYFDGISFDFRKSYEIIRQARQILGAERILFVHSSIDPFNSITFYAPFIDTYADYILRGEAGRPADMELKDFLRWTISGYNISNAVGYWIYYGSAEGGQGKYIFRVPKTEDIALENDVYFSWSDTMYGENQEDLERFSEEYYEKLKSIKQKHGL